MFCWQINEEIDLRLLEPSLTKSLFQLVKSNKTFLTEWLNWAIKASDYDYVENYILYTQKIFSENKGFHAGIYYKDFLVGVITFEYSKFNKLGSIGYWLIESYNGKGIITKAAKAIIEYAFKSICLNRIEIRCAEENIKSQQVPIRLGFTQEGILRHAEEIKDTIINHIVYGLTIEDYNNI